MKKKYEKIVFRWWYLSYASEQVNQRLKKTTIKISNNKISYNKKIVRFNNIYNAINNKTVKLLFPTNSGENVRIDCTDNERKVMFFILIS